MPPIFHSFHLRITVTTGVERRNHHLYNGSNSRSPTLRLPWRAIRLRLTAQVREESATQSADGLSEINPVCA